MSDFEKLLQVQGHDTAIDQLNHRRVNLPEREQAVAVQAEIATVQQQVDQVSAERDELERRQRSLEGDATLVEEKADRENAKLYSGTVTGVKELQALQDEIASLKRHQSSIEDNVIEVMEALEPVNEQLDTHETSKAQLTAKLEDVQQVITVAEAEIDAELASENEARSIAVEAVPEELFTRYQSIRAGAGGVGVAKFEGGRCEGCHLSLPAMEVDQIKNEPPDAVVLCSSCGRILVR